MPLYEGDAPFIFISYAHKDRELVLPYIRRLEELHYRVWYDKDIRTGTPQWAPVIQQHLKRCKVVVVFLTNGYLASENCGNELETVTKTLIGEFKSNNDLKKLLD